MRTVAAALLIIAACAIALPTPDGIVPENDFVELLHSEDAAVKRGEERAQLGNQADSPTEDTEPLPSVDPDAVKKANLLKAEAAEALTKAARDTYKAKEASLTATKDSHKLDHIEVVEALKVNKTNNEHVLKRFEEKGKEITPAMMGRYQADQMKIHEQHKDATKQYKEKKAELHTEKNMAKHDYHKEKDNQNAIRDEANHNAEHPHQAAAEEQQKAQTEHAQNHPNETKDSSEDFLGVPGFDKVPDPAFGDKKDPAMNDQYDPAFEGTSNGRGPLKRTEHRVPRYIGSLNEKSPGRFGSDPKETLPDIKRDEPSEKPTFAKGFPNIFPPSRAEQKRNLFTIHN